MLNEWIDGALASIASLDPLARTLGAAVAILLETSVLLGLIVPGEMLVIIASTAVASPSDWLAMVAAVIGGALAGESIGYVLGHLLGPALIRSRLGHWIGVERLTRAEELLAERGGAAVFASRFLPVLHCLVPLIAGLSGMSYRRFLAWTTPACTLWALAYVSLAAVSSASYRELSRELQWAGVLFLGALAIGLLLAHFGKKWFARRFLEPRTPTSRGEADRRASRID